jgi:hypothetical protein
MQANEGPWKNSNNNVVSAVTFQETCAVPRHTLLQNDTEDAVEMVRNDGVEPYRSPSPIHSQDSHGENSTGAYWFPRY